MKIFYIIISTGVFLSSANPAQNKTSADLTTEQHADTSGSAGQGTDSSKWTGSFLEFTRAITREDRKMVKSFIDFPIKNTGNEIWYLADPALVMEITPDKIKPFTEADFDRYFSSIFSLDFRKTLEKLDTDRFFKTNSSTSPEIEVLKGSKSKLAANCDKEIQKMTLTLLTTGQKFSEFAVQYEFDITPGQQIRFRQVRVAG